MQRIQPNSRLSKASVSAGVIHTSGLVCPQAQTPAQQTQGILAELDGLLLAAQVGRADIVHVLIHLKDMADYDAMNQVYDQWIDPASVPSRTCVEARLPNPKALVEITALIAGHGS